jgi:hypothetical protein
MGPVARRVAAMSLHDEWKTAEPDDVLPRPDEDETDEPSEPLLDPRTIEVCARACEKSYRTAVDGLNSLTGEAAATAARAWAARCIRSLARNT